MKISKKKLLSIDETLKDFKCLIPRYVEVKHDKNLLELFCSRNRNPIWDITNISYFKTGLLSESAKSTTSDKLCDDHFIQRKLSMRLIMESLEKNPNITLEEFIFLIKKYSSTVKITKEEHSQVSQKTKKSNQYNFKVYEELGIVVKGIEEYIGDL
jgi:hypothetical protein